MNKKLLFALPLLLTLVACENTYDVKHQVTSIEIHKAPNKTEYIYGEEFSSEGMVLKVMWEDGFFSYVEDFEKSIEDGTKLTTQHSEVEVRYKGFNLIQPISVKLPDNLFSLLNSEHYTSRLEAEDSTMVLPEGCPVEVGLENRTLVQTNYPSGDAFVSKLNSASAGSEFTWTINSPSNQMCVLTACLGSVGKGGANRNFDNIFSIKVNDLSIGVTTNPLYTQNDYLDSNGQYTTHGYYNWTNRPITIFDLKEGENVITFTRVSHGNTGLNFDYIELNSNGELNKIK